MPTSDWENIKDQEDMTADLALAFEADRNAAMLRERQNTLRLPTGTIRDRPSRSAQGTGEGARPRAGGRAGTELDSAEKVRREQMEAGTLQAEAFELGLNEQLQALMDDPEAFTREPPYLTETIEGDTIGEFVRDPFTQDVTKGVFAEAIEQSLGSIGRVGVATLTQLAQWESQFREFVGIDNIPIFDEINTAASQAILAAFQAVVPPEATTTTGKLIADFADFGLAMAILKRPIAPIAGPLAKGTTAVLGTAIGLEAAQAQAMAGKLTKAGATILATGGANVITNFSTRMREATAAWATLLSDPENPLRDELASFINAEIDGEEESEAQKVLGDAMEGLGIGAIFEVTLGGMKAFKLAKTLRRGLDSIGGFLDESQAKARPLRRKLKIPGVGQLVELEERDLSRGELVEIFGDAKVGGPRALTQFFPTDLEAAAERLSASIGQVETMLGTMESFDPEEIQRISQLMNTGEMRFNILRIDSGEDVEMVYLQMENIFGDFFESAKGAPRTQEDVMRRAQNLGFSLDDILGIPEERVLNDSEIVRVRIILDAAAQQVAQLASNASAANSGVVDKFLFRKAQVNFVALAQRVFGLRAETARAQNAWNINIDAPEGAVRQMRQILQDWGGEEMAQGMAARITTDTESGVLGAVSRNVSIHQGGLARSMAAWREIYVNSMLWQPATHMTNMGSFGLVLMNHMMETGLAARLAPILSESSEGSVTPGEALSFAQGIQGAFYDMIMLGRMSMDAGIGGSRIDIPRAQFAEAISAEAANLKNTSVIGGIVNVFGILTRQPGKFLGTTDSYMKTVAARGRIHQLASRMAYEEGGSMARQNLRKNWLIQSPTTEMLKSAKDFALYTTFQTPAGDFTRALLQMRNAGPLNPLFLIFPFINTPANITRYAFERTPGGVFLGIGGGASDSVFKIGGGEAREMAASRMMIGTLFMGLFMDLAWRGKITGAGPVNISERENLRAIGVKPFHVVLGPDESPTYHSYNRLDAIGQQLAVIATFAETFKAYDLGVDDMPTANQLMADMMRVISTSVLDRTYFNGAVRAISALHDPQRYGQAFAENLIGSQVPFNSAFRTINRLVDPTVGLPENPWESIMNSVVLWQASLPRRKDRHGFDMTAENTYALSDRAYNFFSMAKLTRPLDSPFDRHVQTNDLRFGKIEKKDHAWSWSGSSGVSVSMNFHKYPRVYERYQELAGHELNTQQLAEGEDRVGLFVYLQTLVDPSTPIGAVFLLLPLQDQQAIINDARLTSRELAREIIMQDLHSSENSDLDSDEFQRFRASVRRQVNAEIDARIARGVQIESAINANPELFQ